MKSQIPQVKKGKEGIGTQEIIETPDILITIKKTGYNAELATQVI